MFNTEKCYDKLAVFYLDAGYYVDPSTRKNFEYAIQISCESKPQIVIALDPVTDQYNVLTLEPIEKRPSSTFRTNTNSNCFQWLLTLLHYSPLLFLLQFAFIGTLCLYCSFTAKQIHEKQITLLRAFGYGFSGA